MTEFERVSKSIDIVIANIKKNGVSSEGVSIDVIAQSTIEIAKELAILNDYLKGEKDEQCESGASASD